MNLPFPSPTSPLPEKNGVKRPEWWAFAHHCIARLRDIETDIADLERRAKSGDTEALENLMDYEGGYKPRPPSRSGAPSAPRLLTSATRAPHLAPEDWEAIVAAGGDPFATDAEGSSQPAIMLPLPDLILLTRLAATFRDAQSLQQSLQPGAITIVIGLEPTLRLGKLLTGTLLPDEWTTHSRAPEPASSSVLQLPDRPLTAKELERCLHLRAPVLLPVSGPEDIPPLLATKGTGVRVLDLTALSADILVTALSASHSATGRIDENSVRAALPNNEMLADLDSTHLAVACRAQTAAGVAKRIALLSDTSPSPEKRPEEARPEGIDGTSPAHQAARDIVQDLADWQKGQTAWDEMTRSLLIHGEPGTGKSFLARQMSVASGISLVEGSFALWQAAGHLGQMLAAMNKCFDDALAQTPCILFIDEIDAVGSRFSSDQHGMSYRTQVVNGFLQQIDKLALTPGVVLVGACNQLDRLDPAVTRPGRFDQIVRMPLPSLQDIARILHHGMSGALSQGETEQLARGAVGKTPAELDAAMRAAKGDARRQRIAMSTGLLRLHLGIQRCDPARLHRIAVHEVGHALTAELFEPGAVVKVSVSDRTGLTERTPTLRQLTVEEIETELLIVMSGRAAERLVLGTISGGAGGDARSDLAQATTLVLQMDRELGLGQNGDGWLGPADMQRLSGEEKQRIRAKLGQAMNQAAKLLTPHIAQLNKVATILMDVRELQGPALRLLLAEQDGNTQLAPK